LTILSGHYDSRGSFGRWGAPGADDDASGSAHLLAIAQAIQHAKVTFKHEVVLAFFAGEEQGLLGSAAYASECLMLYLSLATMPDMLSLRVAARGERDRASADPGRHAGLP
jgi:hypothetical protein